MTIRPRISAVPDASAISSCYSHIERADAEPPAPTSFAAPLPDRSEDHTGPGRENETDAQEERIAPHSDERFHSPSSRLELGTSLIPAREVPGRRQRQRRPSCGCSQRPTPFWYHKASDSTTNVPPTRSVTVVLRDMGGVAYTTGTELDNDHKEIHFSLGYI